ncbi:restriction endonuclease subunit S [Enterovibrio norvegicus]|uniref:restriction endonuclease subunit S n=1 Tax=Enterovibrio norvegicus TaxID=188144 RepID=UPI00389AD0B3
MESEWIDYELGDVIELKRGYDLPKTKRLDGDVAVVSSSGKSGLHNESKVKAPGVVTGRYGTIGEVFFVENDFWPLNTTLYVKDFKGNDPSYIYYFMKTISYKDYTDKAAVPGINRNHIHKAKVRIPSSIEYQKKIAKNLTDLDRKITLNRQINQTLEQMAQTLFKSWFVDFDPVIDNALDAGNPIPDELQHRVEARKTVRECEGFKPLPDDVRQLFPDAFEESELGWVPKGWVYQEAETVASVSIGKTPPRKESQWFSENSNDNLIWVSIRDMGRYGAFTGRSSEYLTQDAVSKFNVKRVPKDSVLLSFKLTLGRVAITDSELTTNEAIAHFVNPKSGLNKEFLYSYLSTFDYGRLGSTSSIATAVNSKIIKKMPILVPTESASRAFESQVGKLFEKMKLIDNEVTILTDLRDTLLPKLISGELRLDDVEEAVEQETVSA